MKAIVRIDEMLLDDFDVSEQSYNGSKPSIITERWLDKVRGVGM